MSSKYKIQIFGKKGCDKCTVLNQRVDKLLKNEAWSEFEKMYSDIETESGMVAFAEAECINPQRIPAMMIMRLDQENDDYLPVPNPVPGKRDTVFKNSKLYQHLGLQTDYTEVGRGVISPKMIKSCFQEAIEQTNES